MNDQQLGPDNLSPKRGELASTIVLAIASILTAWAAFQSAKWNGQQMMALSDAAAARVESARASDLAAQLANIDVYLFVQWLEALAREPRPEQIDENYAPAKGSLQAFLYARFRDEFKPALKAWLRTRPMTNADAPKSPFAMREYHLSEIARSRDLEIKSEELSKTARRFNATSDRYMAAMVPLSLVLFFAAVGSKAINSHIERGMILISAIMLIVCSFVLLNFPVAI